MNTHWTALPTAGVGFRVPEGWKVRKDGKDGPGRDKPFCDIVPDNPGGPGLTYIHRGSHGPRGKPQAWADGWVKSWEKRGDPRRFELVALHPEERPGVSYADVREIGGLGLYVQLGFLPVSHRTDLVMVIMGTTQPNLWPFWKLRQIADLASFQDEQ